MLRAGVFRLRGTVDAAQQTVYASLITFYAGGWLMKLVLMTAFVALAVAGLAIPASAAPMSPCPSGNSVCIDETVDGATPTVTFSNASTTSPLILSATATPACCI